MSREDVFERELAAVSSQTNAPSDWGWVYAITYKDVESPLKLITSAGIYPMPLKFGFTNDVKRRIAAFQGASPFVVHLILTLRAPLSLENAIHARLGRADSDALRPGATEWYWPDGESLGVLRLLSCAPGANIEGLVPYLFGLAYDDSPDRWPQAPQESTIPQEWASDPMPRLVARGIGEDEIAEAISQAGGNRALAAKNLGIGRATLYRRLDKAADES